MQNAECRMQNAKCKMQNAKCKMQNAKCRTDAAEREGKGSKGGLTAILNSESRGCLHTMPSREEEKPSKRG